MDERQTTMGGMNPAGFDRFATIAQAQLTREAGRERLAMEARDGVERAGRDALVVEPVVDLGRARGRVARWVVGLLAAVRVAGAAS